MAIAQGTALEEVLEFLVSSPTPQQIVAFRPSIATQEHIRHLLDANQKRKLTTDEESELEEFDQIEHLMRMLKAKARLKLNQS